MKKFFHIREGMCERTQDLPLYLQKRLGELEALYAKLDQELGQKLFEQILFEQGPSEEELGKRVPEEGEPNPEQEEPRSGPNLEKEESQPGPNPEQEEVAAGTEPGKGRVAAGTEPGEGRVAAGTEPGARRVAAGTEPREGGAAVRRTTTMTTTMTGDNYNMVYENGRLIARLMY